MKTLELISQIIDPIIMALVFLSGFFQDKYMTGINLVKDLRLDASLKTLLVSLIVSTIYIFLIYTEVGEIAYVRYFFTFFTATSIYDFAIRPFRKWIIKVTSKYFPSDEDPKQQ